MKLGKLTLFLDSRAKWGLFALMVFIQLGALAYAGWRWHNISVDGIPYQWQCVTRVAHSSFGTDYIDVSFPEDTAQWLDEREPVPGQAVYIHITRDDKGVLVIQGASGEKPAVGGDYMKASVLSSQYGTIKFRVGFDRYRMDPRLTDGIYDISASDSVIASIRIKKGDGVIEGIFVNGMPLELCSSQALEAAQHTGPAMSSGQPGQPGLGEAGMVPPQGEK